MTYPPGFPAADLELVRDLPFGPYGLRLDLLRLRERPPGPQPAVLHLHGGGWVKFGKWPVACEFLARAGFVALSADYRLAPRHVYPAQLEDVQDALRWIRAEARTWDMDAGRIGLWGISAGAHLAALGALVPGADVPAVQAVGNVSGPMDFFDPAFSFGDEPFELLGGPWRERQDLARTASPVSHVRADAPPFLHVHGVQDDEVPVSQARRMHAALTRVGAPSELVELDGGHYINDTHQSEVEGLLQRFFERQLRPDRRHPA